MTRRRVILVALVAVMLAAGGTAAWLLRPQPRALAWRALLNATYTTSLVPRGAQLRDGIYDVEAAPGSASRVVVRLADVAAFGDLDADRELDAAVILVSSGGGSGTFIELGAVRNEAGQARPLSTALLGDRVLVREVRIDSAEIAVRMRTRGASDPLSQRTREITRRYALVDGRLALRSETESEVPTTPAEDYVYRPERVDLAVGASREIKGSLAPGQLSTYLIHARAGETLDLSVRSEFDNAVLSVSGLDDGVTFVSRRDYAVDRSLVIGTEQDYAVRVVTLAGAPLPFTLRLGLRAASASPTPTSRPSDAPRPTRTPAAQPSPSQGAQRPLGVLSSPAATFARSRSPIWGVAVAIPSRGVIYAENADEQVPTASVVKLLVMLVVLEQARQDHRPVTDGELALLWPMITESDNDSTSQLWESIGRGQAVAGYLRGIGVTGFTPDPGTSWGVSFVSARGLATALGKLIGGELLDGPSRSLALKLLDSVVPSQRWGVTAGTDPEQGDHVGLKNGWYPGDEGWRVNSAGVVRTRAGAEYAIAIVTGGRESWEEGIATIEGIAAPINAALR